MTSRTLRLGHRPAATAAFATAALAAALGACRGEVVNSTTFSRVYVVGTVKSASGTTVVGAALHPEQHMTRCGPDCVEEADPFVSDGQGRFRELVTFGHTPGADSRFVLRVDPPAGSGLAGQSQEFAPNLRTSSPYDSVMIAVTLPEP